MGQFSLCRSPVDRHFTGIYQNLVPDHSWQDYFTRMRLLIGLLTVVFLLAGNGQVRSADISSFQRIPVRFSVKSSDRDLTSLFRKELGTDTQYTWIEERSESDQLGGIHTRFVQSFQGYPVQDGMIILHQTASEKFVTGVFISLQTQEKITVPIYSAKQISDIFLKSGIRDTTDLPPGTFVWSNENGNGKYKLVYSRDYFPAGSLERQTIIVDAESLEIICEKHTSCHADVIGIASTAYYQVQAIPTFQNGASFFLKSTTRGLGIFTRNLNYQMNYQHVSEFTDNDNNWQQPSLPGDQYATDAHFCAVTYYDFLNSMFNRNSLDNSGYPLLSYLNYGTSVANAFWNGQAVVYGSGNGSTTPLTTMDITGHEFTHGLIQKTAGLSYSGEPGTINESIADIFGVALENFNNPQQANWLIGEQSGITLRSFSQPGDYNQPAFYHGVHWYYGTGDQGGVHINSGFINKWFYLLAHGEQGVNESGASYHVTGIGIQNATALVYHTLTSYLIPGSGFEDLRVFTLQSAIDLYGSCSSEYNSVLNAWDAVGMGNSNLIPLSVISGNQSICPDDSVLIVVPFNPGSNYNWYRNGIPVSSGTNPEYYANEAGTWTVLVQRCNISTVSSAIVISQHSTSVISTSNAQACSGYPVVLQGSPAGGSYNVPNPYLGGSTNFTYSLTDTNGCTVHATGFITILESNVVNFLNSSATYPVNENPIKLQADQQGIFSGPGVSGNNFYPQLAGAGAIASLYVTVTDIQGCISKDSVIFTVTEPCIKDHETIQIEGTQSIVEPGMITDFNIYASPGDFRIKWLLPEGCIAVGSIEENHVRVSWGNQSGIIKAMLVNTCYDTLYKELRVAVTASGLEIISVYPNPATSFFNIRIPATAVGEFMIVISDNSGKAVMQKVIYPGVTKIDTQNLGRGVYLVAVTGRNFIVREKLVVQ